MASCELIWSTLFDLICCKETVEKEYTIQWNKHIKKNPFTRSKTLILLLFQSDSALLGCIKK